MGNSSNKKKDLKEITFNQLINDYTEIYKSIMDEYYCVIKNSKNSKTLFLEDEMFYKYGLQVIDIEIVFLRSKQHEGTRIIHSNQVGLERNEIFGKHCPSLWCDYHYKEISTDKASRYILFLRERLEEILEYSKSEDMLRLTDRMIIKTISLPKVCLRAHAIRFLEITDDENDKALANEVKELLDNSIL